MVRPVQGLYRRFRESHRLPTEATHVCIVHKAGYNYMYVVKVELFKSLVIKCVNRDHVTFTLPACVLAIFMDPRRLFVLF